MTLRALQFPRAATRLSWFGASFFRQSSAFGRFAALARASLAAFALSMLSGCLVDDPPPYVAPQQTPPRLDSSRALPGPNQLIITKSNEVLDFSIPVTSEDAGDPLSAILLLDYLGDGSGVDFLNFAPVPASTLDDKSRVISVPWTVRPAIAAGCHLFTLRVTHLKNVDKDHHEQAINKADQAEAYWFANINVTPENANMLVNCPQGSTARVAP